MPVIGVIVGSDSVAIPGPFCSANQGRGYRGRLIPSAKVLDDEILTPSKHLTDLESERRDPPAVCRSSCATIRE